MMVHRKNKGEDMQTAMPRAADQAFTIETDREEDGRWIAEVPQLPGVMTYGNTRQEAIIAVQALALRVLADRMEEEHAATKSVSFAFA